MRKRRRRTVLALIIAGVILICAVCVKLAAPTRIRFTENTSVSGNPLMGFAPSAWYPEVPEDVTLLYVDITWRELEPKEGRFAWQSIDEENQLERWRAEGKHIVLRFLCDVPGEEPHRDVPDWLFEKIGTFGEEYAVEYGCGFAPDYSNAQFREYHDRAVRALGAHYGQDGFFSFIELGSLGHWGEWHVNYESGLKRLPLIAVRSAYAQQWAAAFPHAKILMRRPFAEAQEYGFGLYNDVFGNARSTNTWLDWIQNGGSYDQTGEENALVPLPGQWQTAPVGGELTSSIPMEEILTEGLQETAQQLAASHVSFLGPKTAKPWDGEGYRALLSEMGYRLWISRMELRRSFGNKEKVTLVWENSGAAPFYFDWPIFLTACDAENRPVFTVPVEFDLRTVLPGKQMTSTTRLPEVDFDRLLLGIVDPMTGRNAVSLAMTAESENNAVVLFEKNK